MAFPPSPTQFAVPSLADIPAVMPKGGIREVSIEPEGLPEEAAAVEEATRGEASVGEAVEGAVAAAVAEVSVMKVLETSPPP